MFRHMAADLIRIFFGERIQGRGQGRSLNRKERDGRTAGAAPPGAGDLLPQRLRNAVTKGVDARNQVAVVIQEIFHI
jgi:hypothetical protein